MFVVAWIAGTTAIDTKFAGSARFGRAVGLPALTIHTDLIVDAIFVYTAGIVHTLTKATDT